MYIQRYRYIHIHRNIHIDAYMYMAAATPRRSTGMSSGCNDVS